MSHKIIFRSSEKMRGIDDETVQTIVTSPPYWDLKNYKHTNQIGYKETYRKYLSRMDKVWRECFRVLKKEGSFFVNINYRRFNNSIFRIHDDFLKQLLAIGFIFQEKIIWHKPSGIPTALPRFADRYEYVFHLTKQNDFYFDSAVKFNDYKTALPDERYNVWRLIKKAGSIGKQFEHPAIFPINLSQRSIELTSRISDFVLDPFLGSGTTTIASIKSKRNSFGFEINANYKDLIEYRIKNELKTLESIEFCH